MATIEERVVSMKFQGDQFLAGIDKSLAKLEQLNQKLKMAEGAKGLTGIGTAAQQQSGALSKIGEGVQHISDKFKAMGVIGMTALSNVTNQAIFAGQNLAKSLTIDPIMQGFKEYELNMNSIQTILANTQAAGTKLSDVTKALDELNHYSDQTIYNFAEMSKNIGTFTAAGVGLKPATAAIKGIANLAALSGSNSQQASAAMYQLSQAISSGRVSLEDWNSVVNAGMGGTVFQRALAQTAEKVGTLDKGAVKLKGEMKNVTIAGKSFRESITAKPGQESWLTSDVLTKTLSQFTGDLKDAELAAMGFDKAQIKAIQAQAKTAKAAATEVKTLSQLMGTLKESAGSGWSQTWKTVFGDFPEAKKLFTGINNAVGGFVSASADARNKVLKDWAAMGGRTALFDGIAIAFNNLMEIVTPIKKAFSDIFPPATGKQLADLSKSFRDFMSSMRLGEGTMDNLRRTFRGLFAAIDIGLIIGKEFVGMIFKLLGVATKGSGGFLNFTGNVGDWIVKVRDAIKNGEGLKNFFAGLGKALAVPINLIKRIVGFIGQLAGKAGNIEVSLSPLQKIGALASTAWDMVLNAITTVWDKMAGFRTWVSGFFGELGGDIASLFSGLDFGDVLAGLNTGLFAGLLLMLRNVIGGGGGLGGIMENISDGFENVTNALGAMQNTLRAATLLQIAIAVGILALAMNTLSKIDAAGLTRASVAITVMFTQLMTALLLFEKFSGFVGFAKMPFIAASMILMAVAVNILASAVKKLAELSWEDLAKGLVGTTVLIAALTGALHLMPNPGSVIASAAGLILLAVAVRILVSAVSDLSELSWEELGKGLVGVGAILASLTLFTKFAAASKGGLLQGAGLVLLAVAIKILASAVEQMAGLQWDEIARGLTTMAGAMAIMTASLMLIPPTAPLAALGVVGVAVSLGLIAAALQQLGGMSWGDIGKSLTTMLGALTIIAAALVIIPPTAPLGAASILIVAMSLGMIGNALQRFAEFSWEEIKKSATVLSLALGIISLAMIAMQTALPGAAALLVVSAALAIFTPVLMALGAMSWDQILTGLVALAGAFTVIGVAGLLLTPVVPTLLGFGVAVALLGAGLALTGAGLFLFATGLTLVAGSGVAAAGALVAMVEIILGALPKIVKLTEALLVALLDLIIKASPKIGKAFVAIMNALIDAVVKVTPKIVDMVLKLLTAILGSLSKYIPRMAEAGSRLITGILNGIAARISSVVTAATNVIVAFINGISRNLPRIINAGQNLVINFVNGLANSIRSNTGRMRSAGLNLATAIIDGMTGGLASGVGRIASKAREVAASALAAAKSVLGINSPSKEFEKIGKYVNDGFRKGLDGNKGQIDSAFKSMTGQITALYRNASNDVTVLTKKLKALNKERKKDKQEIRETTAALRDARKERAQALAVSKYMKTLNDEHSALGRLATQYDVLTAKLKNAKEGYANAVKTRNDYNAQIRTQIADMPSPTGEIKAADYVKNLQKQVKDTKSFANQLQQLRKLGLNDEVYKDLLSTGISALPFVTDLLKGGRKQITQINALSNQLDSLGVSMGKTASKTLYQAAVDSAAGLVKGLQNQQIAIEKQMDRIAVAMINAIKRRLGIKSPSKVFAQLGGYSAEGLSAGLRDKADVVANSASSIGDKAVEAMRLSLANVDKMVMGNIDIQPTIRPVLDLTDIQKNASKIGTLLPNDAKMTVGTSYSRAATVAAAVRDRQDATDSVIGSAGAVVSYTQINNSPKALSSVEIYRGTKNQLSTVRGALKV